MPTPVSLTTTSTFELTRSSRTCTLPPRLVNFTAFDNRFHSTCCRRSGSPEIGPAFGSSTVSTRRPLASAASAIESTAVRTTAGTSTVCTLSRILPETMRETSRTSSTICVNEVTLRSIVSSAFCCLSGGTMPERRRRAYPRIALSGAQFVRQAGQEIVLETAGILHAGVQTRILERHRCPRRDAHRELLVMLGETADRGVAEEQSTDRRARAPLD